MLRFDSALLRDAQSNDNSPLWHAVRSAAYVTEYECISAQSSADLWRPIGDSKTPSADFLVV